MNGQSLRIADGDGTCCDCFDSERRCTIVAIGFSGSLHHPACGDTVDTSFKVVHLRHLDEGTCCGYTIEPTESSCIAKSCGEALYVAEVGAATKHRIVGIARHDAGRQVGSLCQAGTLEEHHGVAAHRQCGGRQLRSLYQSCTSAEHIIIAVGCKRCGGQSRSRSESLTSVEHASIAHGGEHRSRQHQFVVRMALDGGIRVEFIAEQPSKRETVGQCLVGSEGILVDKAHHIAIDIDGVGGREVGRVTALIAVVGVDTVELHLVASGHCNADNLVLGGSVGGEAVFTIAYILLEWILDDDGTCFDGFHCQRCGTHVAILGSSILHCPSLWNTTDSSGVAVIG